MKRIAAVLVALCVFASPVYAKKDKKENISQVEIKFMDIPWNSTMEDCKSTIVGNSFEVVKNQDDCYVFSGTFMGYDTNIIAVPVEGTKALGKMAINIDGGSSPFQRFNEFEDLLDEKYGPAKKKGRIYKAPYNDSDSEYFETGIRIEKIFIFNVYEDIYGNSIVLEISKDLDCKIYYESKGFLDSIRAKEKNQSKAF